MKEIPRKDNIKNILIVILSLIIIGGILYILYDRNIIFKEKKDNKNNTEIKRENKTEDKLVEKDLDDVAIKNTLIGKMRMLIGLSETKEIINNYSFVDSMLVLVNKFDAFSHLLNNDLSEKDKLAIALASTSSTKMTKSFDEMNFAKKEKYKNLYDDTSLYSEISLNDLKNIYIYLFGTSEFYYDDYYFGYYEYFYDSLNKVYYKFDGQQQMAVSAPYLLMYINSFKSYGNVIYVNVNLGFLDARDRKVCTSFDTSFLINNCENLITISTDEMLTYKIDESNYEQFKNYKFVFGKDKNNNYIFKGLE